MHKDTAGGIGANTRKQALYHEVRLLSLKMGQVYHGGKYRSRVASRQTKQRVFGDSRDKGGYPGCRVTKRAIRRRGRTTLNIRLWMMDFHGASLEVYALEETGRSCYTRGRIGKTALAIRAAYLAPEKLFERKMFITAKVRELAPEGADISITEQEFPKDFQSLVL